MPDDGRVPAPGEAVAWAYGIDTIRGTEKFALVTLGLYASLDEDGRWTAWPGARTLAANLGVGVDAARRAVRSLEAAGLLAREGRERPNGSSTSNRYVLAVPPSASAPTGGMRPGTGGVGADAEGGYAPAHTPPEPPEGTPTEPQPNDARVRTDPRIPATVNRKHVTVSERLLAVRILDYWHRRTGVAVTGTDVARAIIGRMREDGIDVNDGHEDRAAFHKRIIDVNLAAPWWEGRATPVVLYGNGKAWNAAKARTAGPRTRHPDQDPTGDRVVERDRRRADAAIEDAKQYEGEPDATF